MHPENFTARKGLPRVGYRDGDHFCPSTVHEHFEINMMVDIPARDTFNLKIELLDLKERRNSVTEGSPLCFYFPPGFIPTTGQYAPQSTDLSEQMAGRKRLQEDEETDISMTKRRVAFNGRGGKNDNSATPLENSIARDGQPRKQTPVIIDLSDDEEQSASNPMQLVKAIMKPLPPDSISGDFPRFNRAAVYIIVDPQNSLFQYRLHKTVLCRVSPSFAKVLHRPCPNEAMEKLKVASTDAEARFELLYSHRQGIWILRRTPFTLWKLAGAGKNTAAVENVSKTSGTPGSLKVTIIPPALKPTTFVESGKLEYTTSSPATLSPGIVSNHNTTIDITRDGGSNLQEDSDINTPTALLVEQSPMEHQTQLGTTEQDENPGGLQDSVSVKPEDDGQDGQTSVDQPLIKLDATTETEKDQLTMVSMNSDLVAVNSTNSGKDEITTREEGDTTASVSSPGNEDIQILRTGSEHDTQNDQGEALLPVSAGIDLKDPTVGSTKFEDNLTIKSEEDKSTAINSTPTLDGGHSPAEPSSKRDVTPFPKPVPATGPPIEICEAYNNLFLIFYSKPPMISNTSISTALCQCEAVISIAQRLQCLPACRPFLANAIGRFGNQLYLAVAAEPFRWLKISMIFESAAIFKESMIHIVGAYMKGRNGQINLPTDIPHFVRELIISKVRRMDQQRMDVNERLFASSIIVDSEIVTFSFVDTSILSTWLVVQIWRDWFSRQMAGVHLNPHKTGQLYRTLEKSGDAYLPAAQVRAVIEKIREPVKVDPDVLMEDLGLLKRFAQEAIKGLCENNSMVDLQEAGIDYLTCSQILDEDLPWFQIEQ